MNGIAEQAQVPGKNDALKNKKANTQFPSELNIGILCV
jgi:hypothetical protein